MASESHLTRVGTLEDEINFAFSSLHESASPTKASTAVELEKKRTPRRVLHFSDGVIEEYSTDEEDEETANANKQPPVDPSTLPWSKWMLNRLGSAASNTLSAADYCGEKLAWFFGVTSPKYQYVLDEIQRRELEEREEKEREAREKKAEEYQNEAVTVSVEHPDMIPSKTSSSEPGYDNLVFSSDESCGDLTKY